MNKKSDISELISMKKPQILALTEFGAASSIGDGELGISGYTLYRGDHSSGGGGPGKGAALYIDNALNHSACPKLDDEFDCSAWSIVKLENNRQLLAGVVYRSPNSSDDNNQNLLLLMRKAVGLNCDYLMVCGDYNIPMIDWNQNHCLDTDQSLTANFLATIEELGLFQHVRSATRFRGEQSSCLDLIFTNEEQMVEEITELPPLGKSDHVCQQWNLVVDEVLYRNTSKPRPNFRRANWVEIKKTIMSHRLDPEDAVNELNDKFVSMINDAKLRYVPYSKPKTKHRLPWMSCPKLKKQRSAKWQCWKKFRKTKLPRDYDAYKMERNRLKDMIRSSKVLYEQRLIGNMKENPSLYHGHCRRTLKTKQGVTNVLDANGVMTETEEETAVALNTYYHSVFTEDDQQSGLPVFPALTDQKITEVIITRNSVEEALQELKPNKAAGPDDVESRLLKECAVEVAPYLCEIYQKSMDESKVPEKWKEAVIVPIYKKGSKAVMANFRPVALTSIICKIFEKLICAVIMAFLLANNLITQQQHGFIRGRSCQTNILLCLEKWTESIDSGKNVDVAYFDYAKAFDKVSHRLLMVKLKGYGIDGKLLAWLGEYLKDRKQRVMVGNATSPWLEVVSGTTQGTVLGFLLFLIFINDLPKSCSAEDESLVMLLADDTKAYQELSNEEAEQRAGQHALQSRVNKIAEWADTWRMEINPAKSKIMHIGKNNPGLPYFINGSEIATVTTEKDIGFWISDDLSSTTHVNKARCKALAEIGRIKRNFSFIDKRAFCLLYNQRVRPHLDYGMAACPPRTSAESKLLEAVQSKATALVRGLRHKNSEDRRKILGLMTLEERRERGDLIEVFKILKGLTRIDPSLFWEVREARNGDRLVKELAENGRRQRHTFFSYRVIQKWNLLPVEIKTAPSLNSFKSRLDDRIIGK